MYIPFLLILFVFRYSDGCSQPVNSFCDSSFKQDNTFFIAEDGDDARDCSDANPCGSLQGAFSRALEGGTGVLIHIQPGVYSGAQQSLHFSSVNQTNISIQCNATANNDSCVFDLKGTNRFLTMDASHEESTVVELIGLQLKNGFVSEESGGLILTRNVHCLNVENCSFTSDNKALQCEVGMALALYHTKTNLKHSTFDFIPDTTSNIIYLHGLYPGGEKSIAVSVFNVTFKENRSDVTNSMVDMYFSNLTDAISISTLYELNRQIDTYYVCVFIVSPRQINSIYINNSEVRISNGIEAPLPETIHIDYISMHYSFSVLQISTIREIEIEHLDWYGGYFSLTRTVTITGTSNWNCQINTVCTPAWNPSAQLYETAILLKQNAVLTMTGYYVPHSQSTINIENRGILYINNTELIKFDSILNSNYLKLEGDFPFIRFFNQTSNGVLNMIYGAIIPWYVAYIYLDGRVLLSFNKLHDCPSHNSSIKIIMYYYSEGNPRPYAYDGLNYTISQVHEGEYWNANFIDIACKHLSCDCYSCRSSPTCTYCAMTHSCLEDTEGTPLSACPIKMKETCCPNDCNGYNCDTHMDICQCPPMFGGFDCSNFHWWVVLTAVASFGIFLSFFVILGVYKCWQRAMRHKLRDLRDRLEEQHNCYLDRIQNRQVPSSLIIDFKEIRIKRQVGCGSFGEVYEGYWRNSVVAVKKIRIRTSGLSQEEKEEFQQEAAIMSKLLHPNIVLLMGVCSEEPNLCLITEYMQMGSVREILDDRSIDIDWKMTTIMSLDAARGMTYLHGVTPPVIHRDLKTANLLVDHTWKVKVADFGVAKMIKDIDYQVSVLSNSLVNMPTLEAATQANEPNENSPLLHRQAEQYNTTCAGSLRWCAPESMKPKLAATVYGQKVDIYSYGVILWELATREWPYAELKFDFEVMEHVLKGGRLPVPMNSSSQYIALMQDCWCQDPRYRPWFPDIVTILEDMRKSFK